MSFYITDGSCRKLQWNVKVYQPTVWANQLLKADLPIFIFSKENIM